MQREKMIEEILTDARKIAVVGYSNKSHKAGHYVPAYMQQRGYEIIPVNPYETSGLDQPAYPDLEAIPGPVDLVLIFRRSEDVPEVVEQAVRKNARWVWMQLGIINEEAAETAREAGLGVVMNACILVEHRNRTPLAK